MVNEVGLKNHTEGHCLACGAPVIAGSEDGSVAKGCSAIPEKKPTELFNQVHEVI